MVIEQNLELIHVRTRINDLMKEKGLFVVGPSESSQTLANLQQQSLQQQSGDSNQTSPSKQSQPSTSFNSPAFISSSSASDKFVSNDWCFVDCTFILYLYQVSFG